MHARRALYLDGFDRICGDSTAESRLFQRARALGFDGITLYDLPKLQERSGSLADSSSGANRCLANFIRKARGNGIAEIGAAFESVEALHELLDAYQQSRTDSETRLDAFVLEFEWWSPAMVGPGGLYCRDYFVPLGIPCTEAGAWGWSSRLMVAMDSVANRSGARRVVYASKFDLEQARWIVSHSDRVLLSNYIDDPEGGKAFDHAKTRMSTLDQAGGSGEIVVLWSAEGTNDAIYQPYLGDWLAGRPPWTQPHSLGEAEELFVQQWIAAEPSSSVRSRLAGHQWFAWTHLDRNVSLSVRRQRRHPTFWGTFHDPLGRPSEPGCLHNGPVQLLRCR